MKNLAHELIIAVQFLLGKIARSPHTSEQLRIAAEIGFCKLNKLRFKIGSHGGVSKMKLDDSKAGRSPDKHVSEASRRLNLIQLLALLVTLIILLTFISSITLRRVWFLEELIQLQTEEIK